MIIKQTNDSEMRLLKYFKFDYSHVWLFTHEITRTVVDLITIVIEVVTSIDATVTIYGN